MIKLIFITLLSAVSSRHNHSLHLEYKQVCGWRWQQEYITRHKYDIARPKQTGARICVRIHPSSTSHLYFSPRGSHPYENTFRNRFNFTEQTAFPCLFNESRSVRCAMLLVVLSCRRKQLPASNKISESIIIGLKIRHECKGSWDHTSKYSKYGRSRTVFMLCLQYVLRSICCVVAIVLKSYYVRLLQQVIWTIFSAVLNH